MKNKQWIIAIFVVLAFFIMPPKPAEAASNRVLLVYDSENTAKNGYKKIDSVQRVLTSLNLKVRTVSQEDYYKGMLNQKYVGVVTLVNWQAVGLTNQTFIRDRRKFTGIKLHIGPDLSNSEASGLGGVLQKVYQQQYILKNRSNQQLLPFSETMTMLTHLKKSAQTFGTLASQQKDQKQYAYGVVNGKNGYLPYFESSGLSLMTAIATIAHAFGKTGNYQPLLTITKVSPYSNLKLLDQVSAYCYQQNIPFAVSTVTVAKHTSMAAYRRFTNVLKKVENRNGVIFLQTPQVGGATVDSAAELNATMTGSITALSNHQVHPVGISTAGYWNQDRVLRQQALIKANHWLLLPSGSPTFVKQDNKGQIAQESLFAISATTLNTIKQQSALKFTVPTAITMALPSSETKLTDFKQELRGLNVQWFDPVAQNWHTKIRTETTDIAYQAGNYFLNGQHEEVTTSVMQTIKKHKTTKSGPLFSHFFSLQGTILLLFFIVVLIVLLIFIGFGRRIYWRRFKR